MREWRELSWWESRLYLEQINLEKPWENGDRPNRSDAHGMPSFDEIGKIPKSQGEVNYAAARVSEEGPMAPLGALEMMGMKVQRV